MSTTLVYVLLRSNLQWMGILRLKLQTPIADHQISRDKAIDREDGSQLLQSGVDEHPEAYAANTYSKPPQQQRQGSWLKRWLAQFSARNDAIVIRGVHDVATDTSAETRQLEGKLDALVNLVTQLAANQKPASVARVCGIHSSNDHHTTVCPSSQPSGVDDQPETYAANTYNKPPQQQRQDT
ncbi:hypothetical protein Fmac_028627 [Flemingia macrophylla]|uniref:Uncharacterized protein n=1 Tax=Flemingia macrophylla TaxID=520843 RepID=A0ABD1L8E2_9FABA